MAAGPDGTLYVGMTDHVEVIAPGIDGTTAWPDLGAQAIVTSVAVVGTDVLVADAGNRMVLRFDAGGRLAGTIGDDYSVPSPYFDVAGAPDGTLWVADPGRRTRPALHDRRKAARFLGDLVAGHRVGSAAAATPCTSPCAPAARSSPRRRDCPG